MNTSEPRGHRPPLPPDALGDADTSPAELRTLDRLLGPELLAALDACELARTALDAHDDDGTADAVARRRRLVADATHTETVLTGLMLSRHRGHRRAAAAHVPDPTALAAESYGHLRDGLGTSEIPRLLGFYAMDVEHFETVRDDPEAGPGSEPFDRAIGHCLDCGNEIAGLLLRRWYELTADLEPDARFGRDFFR